MINSEYLKDLRPSFQVLKKCHLVTIPEPAFRMRDMKTWCWNNQLSLVWAELVDVSDVDYNYDSMAGFYFTSPQCATLFTLKYK